MVGKRVARFGVVLAAAILAAGTIAWGVKPQAWQHQSEADFADGQFDNTVINNYGELTLGRSIKAISSGGGAALDFVNAFAQAKDGTVYFATSPDGKVYKIAAGKAEEYYAPKDDVGGFVCMTVDDKGNLLVGTGGKGAKLLRLTEANGKVTAKTAFEHEGVDYIWTIKNAPDGSLYLGTGPDGKVWRVDGEGKATTVLETGAKNVLSLTLDAKGNIVAGTDAKGLVIRQDKETGKAFVLLDAGQVDITGLATDKDGSIYASAATSEGNAGEEELEGTSPSKPGKVEPELTEPADDIPDVMPSPNPAKGKKDTSAPKGGKSPGTMPGATMPGVGLITLPGIGIYADVAPPMPPEVREMLKKMEAAKSAADAGKPKGKPKSPLATTKKSKSPPNKSKPGGAGGGEGAPEEGNAVYRISSEGMVTTVLQEPDMMLSLVVANGEVLVGTGGAGKLYSYNPQTEAQTLVERVSNENVMALFAAADGTVYCGTSNEGAVYALGATIAEKGAYTSAVQDAEHTATWGTAALTATTGAGTKATIAVRTGNVRDVKKDENFWSPWSEEIPAGDGQKMPLPAGRFLQYRVTLTGDGKGNTATVQQVRLAYQVENLPPKLKHLIVEAPSGGVEDWDSKAAGAEGPPARDVAITWEASDPNHDELTYRVLYRQAGADEWVQIAKDLKEEMYTWNTRSMPDGKYQIKVIASDAADNTAQDAKAVALVSSPIVVDNTPPVLSDLKVEVDGKTVKVTGVAKDKMTPIADVRYIVDGQADWQPAAASDKIFDSPTEAFVLVTRALSVGEHRITVRATDSAGNSCYEAVTATVK